jgi:uncharacterized LabA/DUF88 family protein
MINEFIKGKVCVFIDAANILYSQQTLGWRVDYAKLKEYFQKECDLGTVYFYTGRVGENNKQNAFLKKLEQHRRNFVKRVLSFATHFQPVTPVI